MADVDGAAAVPGTVTVPVSGMTCTSCERRVARSLLSLPGVEDADVSSRTGRAVLTVTQVPPRESLRTALQTAGYGLGRSPWVSRERSVWRTVGLFAVAMGGAVWLALSAGLADLPSRLTDPAAGGLALVVVLGLTAGVSTCMALVGGLVLGVSASHAATLAADATSVPSLATRMRPHLAFNAGRVVGFGVLGALLGALGATLSLPTRAMGILVLAVAVVMALLGLRLTGISPRLAGWTPTLPTGLGRALGIDAAAGGSYSDVRAALLGAATFFLPCGFTQAVQLYALSTATPVSAGLIMATFALGTTPGLLALAGVPEVATGPRRSTVLRAVGVAVLAFAVINTLGGLRLLGVDPTSGRYAAGQHLSTNVTVADGVQTVRMTQTPTGYIPADTVVYAGTPIRWLVDATSFIDCSAFLRVPDLGVSVNLAAGTNTINLPALPPGTTTFTCVMGMYTGHLVAVRPPAAAGSGSS